MIGKFGPVFPTIGKIFRQFSNDWKIFFQWLENFWRSASAGGQAQFAGNKRNSDSSEGSANAPPAWIGKMSKVWSAMDAPSVADHVGLPEGKPLGGFAGALAEASDKSELKVRSP